MSNMIREKDPLINTLEKMFVIFNEQIEKSEEEDLYAEGSLDVLGGVLDKLKRGDNDEYQGGWYHDKEISNNVPGAYYYDPINDRYPMSRKFQVAHLIGKTKDEEERFRKAEIELTKMGYICLAPAIYDFEIYKEHQEMIHEMCYEKLLACDLCVLITPENIGVSTSITILQAEKLGIPVYTFDGTQLIPFDILEVKYNE